MTENVHIVKREQCPHCAKEGRDNSKDNLVIYSNGGTWCFACQKGTVSEDRKTETTYEYEDKLEFGAKEWEALKSYTSEEGKGFRGIDDDTYKTFGVRHEYNIGTGKLIKQIYPLTMDRNGISEICGIKTREVPKNFGVKGCNIADKGVEFFGQATFKKSLKKTVVIASGECFPPEVEILTENGFIRFDQLTRTEKVLQIDSKSMSAKFTQPLAYIEKDYEGDLVEFDRLDFNLICTPNHNLIITNNLKKTWHLKKIKANEFIPESNVIPLTTSVNYREDHPDKIDITFKQLNFLACIIYDCYTEHEYNKDTNILKISTQSKAQIGKLRQSLSFNNISYTEHTRVNLSNKDYVIFEISLPDFAKEVVESNFSIPNSWVRGLTLRQRHMLIEHFLTLSGTPTNIRFRSLDKLNNLQAIASTCNMGGYYEENNDQDFYSYYISKSANVQNTKNLSMYRKNIPYKGKVYCVTVPSGIILVRYKGKTAVVGNCDAMAAFQMLKHLGDQCPAIVSTTIGEKGYKQYQAQYEFLNKFQKIVIIPDRDKAGKEALKEVAKVLPRDKVYVVELPLKDTNDMLLAEQQQDFVDRYFKAKPYVPDGVLGSGQLYQSLLEATEIKKIPLPEFLHELEDMLAGGLTLESIVNIAAASGIGKSSYINELIYHWIFNSPYKIGVVSLELSAGQYANALFSRHVHKKLSLLSQEEAKEYLESEEAIRKGEELFKNEDGSDRFYLVEDRSSKLNVMQELIEQLIIGCNCKVIVLDPLQDLFAGLSLEQQEMHMAWQKVIVKLYGVCIININHTRKAGNTKESGSTGNMISEEDIQGTSTIYKSAKINILLQRNKLADNALERNTTYVYLSKNRDTGVTGPAGKIIYDNESHTLYDEDTFRSLHPNLYAEEYED